MQKGSPWEYKEDTASTACDNGKHGTEVCEKIEGRALAAAASAGGANGSFVSCEPRELIKLYSMCAL